MLPLWARTVLQRWFGLPRMVGFVSHTLYCSHALKISNWSMYFKAHKCASRWTHLNRKCVQSFLKKTFISVGSIKSSKENYFQNDERFFLDHIWIQSIHFLFAATPSSYSIFIWILSILKSPKSLVDTFETQLASLFQNLYNRFLWSCHTSNVLTRSHRNHSVYFPSFTPIQFLTIPINFVGLEEIVQMLIGKGVNVNAVNQAHDSALILAALNGNVSIYYSLTEKKISSYETELPNVRLKIIKNKKPTIFFSRKIRTGFSSRDQAIKLKIWSGV